MNIIIPTKAITIHLWGSRVGVLLFGDDGYSRFQYFPEFAKHGVEIAPFAMPLSKGNARLIVDEIKSILLDLGFAGGFL